MLDGQNMREQIPSDRGPKITFCAFHSFLVGVQTFSSPEHVVSWSRGKETRGTGRLQIKPSGSGDENGVQTNAGYIHAMHA